MMVKKKIMSTVERMLPLFMNSTQHHFSKWKIEHIVPLYERKSRSKFKREKLIKRTKVKILHLRQNLMDDGLKWKRGSRIGNITNTAYFGKKPSTDEFQSDLLCNSNETIQIDNNTHVEDLSKGMLDELDASSSPTFTQVKRLYFSLKKKGNEALVQFVSNSDFLRICIFMTRKKIRNRVVEEEFLLRVSRELDEVPHSPTDSASGGPTDSASGGPTNFASGGPTDSASNRPTDSASNRPTDSASNRPTDSASNRPTDSASNRPTDSASNRPTDSASSRSSNCPTREPLLSENNFCHWLEFIHHIGLNGLGTCRERSSKKCSVEWNFKKLKHTYNGIMSKITNEIVLNKEHIINILNINDKHLYFDEFLFDYFDLTISMNFETYDEHEITYICKHLSKILFSLSLQLNGIKCESNVQRLVKRYICKSLVFSSEFDIKESLEGEEKFRYDSPKQGDQQISAASNYHLEPECAEPVKLVESLKSRIVQSSFVQTLNKKLKKCVHEYKYYNLVDILEFYTLFDIKKKDMRKRVINEVDKFINIMKYGYHAKALILFSLNRKYLDEENEKSVRRLIRRTSQMLHFYWPPEFIIETIIACCSSFLSLSYREEKGKNKTLRNLFLYLKGNVKKCIHPILLINLLNSLASVGITHFTVFNHIINYVKKKKNSINEAYIVLILKHLTKLGYPNDDLFYSFLFSENALNRISKLPNGSLISLLHIINYYKNGNTFDRKKNFYLGNVFVKSSMLSFYVEYVMFLLLTRQGVLASQCHAQGVTFSTGGGEAENVEDEGETTKRRGRNFLDTSSPYQLAALNYNTLKEDVFMQLLNGLTNLKITNLDMLQYAIDYIHMCLKRINENHVMTVFQFISEHFMSFQSIGYSITRLTYIYLHQIAENNILKLPEAYLPHCAFSTLSFYFIETVLKNKKNNVDLIEKTMIIFTDKIRGGLKILIQEGKEEEEEKKMCKLLHIISAVLQMIYVKIERRLPDKLFSFCRHVEKHFSQMEGEVTMGIRNEEKMSASQHYIFFFSDLFRQKKINHFVNFFSYPYTIDIVIPADKEEMKKTSERREESEEEKGESNTRTSTKKKALFIIDNFDRMYLKNVQLGKFFKDKIWEKSTNCTGSVQDGGRNQSEVGEVGDVKEVKKVKDLLDEDGCGLIEGRDKYLHVGDEKIKNIVFEDNNIGTCLKPYEAIREWFLNNNNYSISYISVSDWESKYM
ncbi:hypothetical protein, conserved [Plasmodium gonderi]|uniref:Uncharacterized protein n=1 Tax=Plasmodium gonderi TaxID=77519 RepID=A0A1Y1JBP4_PLAGO|nr:hypothetical protein, conserved [Plasmodium gonderi]GAW79951.1 hypothetical protein, conserved [Plasmodium gonderi]